MEVNLSCVVAMSILLILYHTYPSASDNIIDTEYNKIYCRNFFRGFIIPFPKYNPK